MNIDIEGKRDAKSLLREQIDVYQETLDQGALAKRVAFEEIRKRCRSFQRFESAMRQLIEAVRNNRPVVTPTI